jgi:hypothetical protein
MKFLDSYLNPKDQVGLSGSEEYIVWWINIIFFRMQETISFSHNILFIEIKKVKNQIYNVPVHTSKSVPCELNKFSHAVQNLQLLQSI